MRVYLDHNATTPLRPEASAAMLAAIMLFGVLAMLWIMSRFMKLSTVFGGAAR